MRGLDKDPYVTCYKCKSNSKIVCQFQCTSQANVLAFIEVFFCAWDHLFNLAVSGKQAQVPWGFDACFSLKRCQTTLWGQCCEVTKGQNIDCTHCSGIQPPTRKMSTIRLLETSRHCLHLFVWSHINIKISRDFSPSVYVDGKTKGCRDNVVTLLRFAEYKEYGMWQTRGHGCT